MVNEILRGSEGATVERGNSARESIDKAIQLGVRKRSVDITVPLRGLAIEVIGAENDFKRTPAAD